MVNKKGFVDMLNQSTGKTKKEIEEAVDLVLDGIKEACKKFGGVKFIGFGTFEVRTRKAHRVLHPQTAEDVNVSARKMPFFKPGVIFKEAMN